MIADRIKEMMVFADKLSNGIDPTSNRSFSNDSVMGIESIRKYNAEVYEILERLLVGMNSKGNKKDRKFPFFLMKDNIEDFQYSETPISISELTSKLNEYVLPGMKKLDARVVSLGLTRMGYLEEVDIDDEKKYKKPTAAGKKIGIIEVKKKNSYGNEYGVNLYNNTAQKFVVNNVESIVTEALADRASVEEG